MKNEDKFVSYLHDVKRLANKTICDYLAYIRRIELDFHVSVEDLVVTSEFAWEMLGKLRKTLKVSESSASSYAVALRLFYEYAHGEKLDKGKLQNFRMAGQDERHWYQECLVESERDVEECLRFIKKLNARKNDDVFDSRCWAFRGQGDAAWGLESSLGRMADYQFGGEDNGKLLRRYERESTWIFQRESSKYLEYRDYTGVDLLALMQHYECKTRLLDFTMSPLTALYMALEQCETDFAKVANYARLHGVSENSEFVVARPNFSLWAVNLNVLLFGGDDSGCKSDSKSFGKNNVESAYKAANCVLDDDSIHEDNAGILPVFPKMCNIRISAQDGLFLMPKCLDCSFEDNLRTCMELPDRLPLKMSEVKGGEMIYKFVFSASLLSEIKEVLLTANVTPKTVYPDLIGLGRFVAQEIQRHVDDRRIVER